jgi:hypothetical protein
MIRKTGSQPDFFINNKIKIRKHEYDSEGEFLTEIIIPPLKRRPHHLGPSLTKVSPSPSVRLC